jgi:hypothetical protein
MSARQTWLMLGAAALCLTFWLYGQSDVVIMVSEQLWSCF